MTMGGWVSSCGAMLPAGRVPPRNEGELQRVTRQFLQSAPQPSRVPKEYTLDRMCVSTLDTYRELVPNA